MDLVYQYVGSMIRLIRETGPQEWYYEELRNMNDINFKYEEKYEPSSEVEQLMSNLSYKNVSSILRNGLFEPYNKEELEVLSAKFTTDNMIVFRASRDLDLQAN